MNTQQSINYKRIAAAIEYIKTNFKKQPGLDEIAENIHLSPFHFQKLFTEWAGTSPKQFLQFVSAEHAKKLLKENHLTLSETAYETGLSGTSRLHDLFIKIEGMTPAEYRNGAEGLQIHYSFSESPFGRMIIASTQKGICYMAFEEDDQSALDALFKKFPRAHFAGQADPAHEAIVSIFGNRAGGLTGIKLHLKGSDFQLKVWEALLKIPSGRLTTYSSIAREIAMPNASRAVGTAIGSNPVAFLIPCHRVIQSSGALGGYMWGETRKAAIIGWESAQMNLDLQNGQ